MNKENGGKIFDHSKVFERYVAFVDILGFGSRVCRDFDGLLETFEAVLKSADLIHSINSEVKLSVYSDSFLLVSETLDPLVSAVRVLQMQTLINDYLVRGGIAYGRHIESARSPHLFMVSEAVVRAAEIEKSVRFPCVRIHPDISIPKEWWACANNIDRGVLYFGGHIIVNPCNTIWGQSAATRVSQMLDDFPEHREKYEWFLELHKAIFSPVPMAPPRFFRNEN